MCSLKFAPNFLLALISIRVNSMCFWESQSRFRSESPNLITERVMIQSKRRIGCRNLLLRFTLASHRIRIISDPQFHPPFSFIRACKQAREDTYHASFFTKLIIKRFVHSYGSECRRRKKIITSVRCNARVNYCNYSVGQFVNYRCWKGLNKPSSWKRRRLINSPFSFLTFCPKSRIGVQQKNSVKQGEIESSNVGLFIRKWVGEDRSRFLSRIE